MDRNLKQNLKASDTWVRGLYMLLFLIVYNVAEAVLVLIIVFQFIHTLLTRKPNRPLLDFSDNLCAYLYEIWLYLSFSSNALPFPFGPWPDESDEFDVDDDDDDQEDFAEPVVVVKAEEVADVDTQPDEKPADEPVKKAAKKTAKPAEDKSETEDWPPKSGE